jgi:hypothetical protein
MPKGKRSKAQMSQRVKQNQTVKINIKNLLPPPRQRGDYIQPRRGMTGDNLNMGNVSRLVAPSIRYAVRPPEFLPLPERINSQGQPQYFTAAPSRQGRPDLIFQETNPSDIEPSKPSRRAIPAMAVPSPQTPVRASAASVFAELPPVSRDMNPFESVQPIQMIRAIDSPSMDESQSIVAAQAATGESRGRGRPKLPPGERGKTKERLQYGPFIPHQFQQGREQAASAAMTGVPPIPASGFIKTPSRTIQDDEEKDGVSTSAGYRRTPPSRTIEDDDEE